LILVDVEVNPEGEFLHFDKAMRFDLSRMIKQSDIPGVGGFLQAILSTADEIRQATGEGSTGGVVQISNKLGLAVARKSIIEYILDKWGKILGGKKLANLATKSLGPTVRLEELPG